MAFSRRRKCFSRPLVCHRSTGWACRYALLCSCISGLGFLTVPAGGGRVSVVSQSESFSLQPNPQAFASSVLQGSGTPNDGSNTERIRRKVLEDGGGRRSKTTAEVPDGAMTVHPQLLAGQRRGGAINFSSRLADFQIHELHPSNPSDTHPLGERQVLDLAKPMATYTLMQALSDGGSGACELVQL